MERQEVSDDDVDVAGGEALRAGTAAIVEAMEAVAEYFELAIAGYLAPHASPKSR